MKYGSSKKGRSERLYGPASKVKRNIFPAHISEEHSGTEDNGGGVANLTLPEIKRKQPPTLLLNGEIESNVYRSMRKPKPQAKNRGQSIEVLPHYS